MATTYFVDGSVVASGDGSLGHAFKTIQEAVNAASLIGGDTIEVAGGNYAENVTIDRPLILHGAGRASTTVTGQQAGPELGAVVVAPGVNNVTVEGFTVIGVDGPAGIERSAIYLQGAHSNVNILDNNVVANGDAGLMGEFGASLTNILIDGNEFSGQTFTGAIPGGEGFGGQFSDSNVPRQLVVLGTNGSGSQASNITFTHNLVSGTAGGTNAAGHPQGNSLVTIDAQNSTVADNDFTGFTNRFGAQLRVREEHTDVQNNDFSSPAGGNVGAEVDNDGVPGTVSGNDLVYGPGNDTIVAIAGNDHIDGGNGTDTIDMTLAGNNGSVVDLAGSHTASSTPTGLDTLVDIENVRGSSGNDFITGDGGANVVYATTGTDTIDGAGGVDTYDASATTENLQINLQANTVSGTGYAGTVANVENVIGGSGNDTITGQAGEANALSGGGGTDTFAGLGAGDTVDGGSGNDAADFSSVARSAATIATGAVAGTFTVTIAGQTVTLKDVGILHFSDGDVVVVGNGSDYTTVQAGVNAATGAAHEVFILNGEYDGQVSVSGKTNLLITGESEAGVVVQAAAVTILAEHGRRDERSAAARDHCGVAVRPT